MLAAANAVAVYPGGVLSIADGPAGVKVRNIGGSIVTLASGIGNAVSIVASGDGLLYVATRSPDLIIQIDGLTGASKTVVGTGTSGYNGNTDTHEFLLPGTQVQVNQPGGLSVDLSGNVVFADTVNHLIRAYRPSTGHVIDDLAGTIVEGLPQGGFNGDGKFAPATQLNLPLGVTATQGPLLVIADTGNQRVRQVGPAPVGSQEVRRGPEVVVSCRVGATWSCQRLPKTPGAAAPAKSTAVTIDHEGAAFAAGRMLSPGRGLVRFLVTEQKPLVPGRYDLLFLKAGRPWKQAISINQRP